jgi:hypothetical protein
MSNLNNNTTQLEALLAKVNALPEAGSGGIDTSDATATADEIFAGETAYTATGKVTGTFTIEDELAAQDDLISQITTLIAQKANPPSPDTSDATATANDSLSGKTAYVNGSKITGTIPSKVATTYTPSTSDQTIASGTYLTGTQTIKGDANLVAGNIKSGVSIFGVAGSYEGSGGSGGSSGATTVSITVNNHSINEVYYWDGSQQIQTVGAGTTETVNALNGVLAYRQEVSTVCSGSYLQRLIGSGVSMFMFLSDGGTMTCIRNNSGAE